MDLLAILSSGSKARRLLYAAFQAKKNSNTTPGKLNDACIALRHSKLLQAVSPADMLLPWHYNTWGKNKKQFLWRQDSQHGVLTKICKLDEVNRLTNHDNRRSRRNWDREIDSLRYYRHCITLRNDASDGLEKEPKLSTGVVKTPDHASDFRSAFRNYTSGN